MDVKAFINEHDSNIDKEYGNLAMSPATLEWLIERALALDRKEREEATYRCERCGLDRRLYYCPCNEPDPLSADLVRLAEAAGIPEDRQDWDWNGEHRQLDVWDRVFISIPGAEKTPRAAVAAALQEIKKGGA